MKYVLIDDTGTDIFTKEFNNYDDALLTGDKDFSLLTSLEKKHRKGFYILETVNPDEDAIDHYDGNPIKSWI